MWLTIYLLTRLIDGATGADAPIPPPAPPTTTGAPGGRRPFIAHINGKRVMGSYADLRRLIEQLAEEQAEKEVVQDKPAKRVRVVVEAGRPVAKQPDAPKAEVIQVQADMRQVYSIAYARAKLKLQNEQDDEESLLMLL